LDSEFDTLEKNIRVGLFFVLKLSQLIVAP
jgi:hypothetical protein